MKNATKTRVVLVGLAVGMMVTTAQAAHVSQWNFKNNLLDSARAHVFSSDWCWPGRTREKTNEEASVVIR